MVFSTSYEQQKEEIEKILKLIFKKYSKIVNLDAYYKYKGEKEDYITREGMITSSSERFTVSDFKYILEELTTQNNLEYILYLIYYIYDAPSRSCIYPWHSYPTDPVYNRYVDVLVQFFDIFHGLSDESGRYYLFREIAKDPLDQIMTYRKLRLSGVFEHAYMCYHVFEIDNWKPDPSSIFHGKKGVIAYCSTVGNILLRILNNDIDKFSKQIMRLITRAEKKLHDALDDLWKQDKVKGCDINLIESIIHDELEEAEKLMRQYGIIRVAFPLTKRSRHS